MRYIDANWIYQMVENRYRVSSGIEHRCERDLLDLICEAPTADVVPKSEVEKIFEKLKARECSNSVCAWCVHATAYGRRNEECDKPYIDKNGKEQKACYVYAKFESLIDKELAELKKEYTEGET